MPLFKRGFNFFHQLINYRRQYSGIHIEGNRCGDLEFCWHHLSSQQSAFLTSSNHRFFCKSHGTWNRLDRRFASSRSRYCDQERHRSRNERKCRHPTCHHSNCDTRTDFQSIHDGINQGAAVRRRPNDSINGGNLVVYDIPVIPAGKVLNVGTDNRLKSVTFVVSSNYGDNTTSGSLGKMMGLINTNAPSATQISSLAFSSTLINPLTLTQELPAITRPIKIDGNIRFNSSSLTTETSSSGSGVILSGKSIVKSAAGSAVTPALPINGFTFAAGSAGTTASPSLLTHVTLGGFGSGAAVKLDAANVSVTNSKFGIDSKGKTLANSIGILSSSSGSNSISGNTIGSSTIAGIQVKSGTPTLRGNTLTSNRDGIQVIGGNANLFGNTISTSTNNGITVTGATATATIGSSTVAADRNIIQSNAVYGIAVLQKHLHQSLETPSN